MKPILLVITMVAVTGLLLGQTTSSLKSGVQEAVVLADSVSVQPVLNIGDAAPSFFRRTLAGGKFFLSDYCGEPRKATATGRKNVVISFFASWCKPCKKEIPELEEVAKRMNSTETAFFLINVGEDAKTVEAYLQENPTTLPVILDQEGVAAAKYCPTEIGDANRYFLPTLAIINKKGVIEHIKTGYEEGDISVVESVLKKMTSTE